MSTQSVRVANELRSFVGKITKGISLSITEHLEEDTPKLTGWAAASWIPALGAPSASTAGSKESALAGALDRSAQETGIATVQGRYVFPGLIFITNNAPYIEALNGGSSEKAPAAFIQSSIVSGIVDGASN